MKTLLVSDMEGHALLLNQNHIVAIRNMLDGTGKIIGARITTLNDGSYTTDWNIAQMMTQLQGGIRAHIND